MRVQRRRLLAVLVALIGCAHGGAEVSTAPEQGSPRPAEGSTWLGWGGPRRNFTSDAVGLANSFPESGPRRLWGRELGGGHSSILVDGSRLYTMYRPRLAGSPGRWQEEEVVISLDAADGRTIWEHRYSSSLATIDVSLGVGPHATPLIVGERLFATGTNKQLVALDKATGDVLWSHDLVKEFDAPPHYPIMPQRPGYSCSPLAYRDTIIVTAGGRGQAVMAFRQDDGRLIWRTGDFGIAPASPILITVDGQDQIVVFASESIVGIDPITGTVLWSHPHPRKLDGNVSTPVWSEDNLLFFSSAHDGGSRVLEVSRSGVKELWFNNAVRIYYGTVIRIGDHYYGSSGDLGPSFLTAVAARTGEVAWRDRSFARSSFVYADGKLIILDEDGNLGLATVAPDGIKVLGKASILSATARTVPTIVGSRVYLRDMTHIVALDIGTSERLQ